MKYETHTANSSCSALVQIFHIAMYGNVRRSGAGEYSLPLVPVHSTIVLYIARCVRLVVVRCLPPLLPLTSHLVVNVDHISHRVRLGASILVVDGQLTPPLTPNRPAASTIESVAHRRPHSNQTSTAPNQHPTAPTGLFGRCSHATQPHQPHDHSTHAPAATPLPPPPHHPTTHRRHPHCQHPTMIGHEDERLQQI